MPRLVSIRLALACALALSLVLALAATALGKGQVASLRVVGGGGKVLAERSVGIGGQVSVKPSPKATCFGAGTGGSGAKVAVKGGTALGLLARAAESTASLRPLLLTDHFLAEFGLGICGVGGTTAHGMSSWYFKVNHKSPPVGGEKAKLEAGDKVLWGFGSYPYPAELALSAPDRAAAGKAFQVRVFAYDENGKKTPAAGATVTGAAGPTNAAGRATVTLSGPARLIARHGKDTPSNREPVCVGGKCPGKPGS